MSPAKIIPAAHRSRLGAYRMPAEWEPHLATYLVWPHNRETWPGKFEPVAPAFARIAAALAQFEPVRILARDAAQIEQARSAMREQGAALDRIELFVEPTNDSWIRDYGPIFINQVPAGPDLTRQLALDWRFNSWGGKYGACELDDAIPRRLAERFGFEVIEPAIVLEGGSVEVDGAGSLLTTESCLLDLNRNAGLGRGEIEDYLKTYLGVNAVLWLAAGIAGDDTDGHIDDLARFVAPGTIVTVVEEDPADANYAPLQENLRRLRAMRDRAGRPFRIETLPMPPPMYYEGSRLPASYANFYIANRGLLAPTFDCPADGPALAALARLFPGRRVVGIPCTDLVWGLGAVHCLTQQHPAPPA